MTTLIEDVIRLNREEVVKAVLYIKVMEKGVHMSDNMLNLLCLFASTNDKDEAISMALERKYVKSWQSGENTVSKLIGFSLLEKGDKKQRNIHHNVFPKKAEDTIAAHIKIHNLL